ncbi:2-oxo-4-hydroxy-4-carboxy-5-ureidoimidazoline decarboxylase [Xanthobacter sp. V3C-3]|uniref:2-oxo-4-hydroxy-4-carboxy-5-ureidoimidazoline decarboxylase n=1 Tax=Xanthobacter lutulentifluminis TaxID=3119935 RepID=UPI00372A4AC1
MTRPVPAPEAVPAPEPVPTLADLNACPEAAFTAHLASVWEHAPWVAGRVVALRPFASVDDLHRAMVETVSALPEPELVALLAGHPDLAGPAARSGTMTAESTSEQGALSLGALPQDEAARWDALNAAYRAKFGFPFVLCARHYGRAAMLLVFEQRLAGTRAGEMAAALREIAQITRYRLAARIAGHDMPDLAGRLTTHVLDTSRGRPAAGMRVALHEVSGALPCGTAAPLVETITDAHGQTAEPLLSGAPLRVGCYELRFHVGDYFRRTGAVESAFAFLDVVPVVFCIDEPTGDYHVPLTVTPWAYATYRGQ